MRSVMFKVCVAAPLFLMSTMSFACIGACPDTTTYHIGDLYPATGTPDSAIIYLGPGTAGQRVGIAVALTDAVTPATTGTLGVNWDGPSTTSIPAAQNSGLFTTPSTPSLTTLAGLVNTQAIEGDTTNCGSIPNTGGCAARSASNYSVSGDTSNPTWYLPSQAELSMIWDLNATIAAEHNQYTLLATTGSAFGSGAYWSSTEYSGPTAYAWAVFGGTGYVLGANTTLTLSILLLECVPFGLLTIRQFNNLLRDTVAKRREIFMALYYDLPVYRDTYRLILKIFEYTKEFSKEYKHTLGQDMKRDAMQLVRNIYRANKAVNKKVHLEAFLDDFELIKLQIRLCADMKILPIKKQAMLVELMEGISKQVTGWRNASAV